MNDARTHWLLAIALLAWPVAVMGAAGSDKLVLAIARAFPDGGGYDGKWGGHGVPEDIVFKGATILSKAKSSHGSYCCGFAFTVAMKAAARRGLLADKTVAQVRAFQKHWYGCTKESRERQCAMGVEVLGIGREVKLRDARPGDFVMIWRASGSGHSVVFLGWARDKGRRVGIRYRSSQGSTKGIGDLTEYFAGVKGKQGIDPKRTYVARLHTRRKRKASSR